MGCAVIDGWFHGGILQSFLIEAIILCTFITASSTSSSSPKHFKFLQPSKDEKEVDQERRPRPSQPTDDAFRLLWTLSIKSRNLHHLSSHMVPSYFQGRVVEFDGQSSFLRVPGGYLVVGEASWNIIPLVLSLCGWRFWRVHRIGTLPGCWVRVAITSATTYLSASRRKKKMKKKTQRKVWGSKYVLALLGLPHVRTNTKLACSINLEFFFVFISIITPSLIRLPKSIPGQLGNKPSPRIYIHSLRPTRVPISSGTRRLISLDQKNEPGSMKKREKNVRGEWSKSLRHHQDAILTSNVFQRKGNLTHKANEMHSCLWSTTWTASCASSDYQPSCLPWRCRSVCMWVCEMQSATRWMQFCNQSRCPLVWAQLISESSRRGKILKLNLAFCSTRNFGNLEPGRGNICRSRFMFKCDLLCYFRTH